MRRISFSTTLPADIYFAIEKRAVKENINFGLALALTCANGLGMINVAEIRASSRKRKKQQASQYVNVLVEAPQKPMPQNIMELMTDPVRPYSFYHMMNSLKTWPDGTPITDQERVIIKQEFDNRAVPDAY